MDLVRKKTDTHRVRLVVTPQAPIFELAVPCEVFGVSRPELASPWYDFRICSSEPEITVAHEFKFAQTGTLEELSEADTIVISACADIEQKHSTELLEAIRQARQRGARIASICSGAFLLAQTGLLDHRRATTHWMHADELVKRYPSIHVDPTVLYTSDEGIYTSAGTAAAIDLCLELVREDHGAAVANNVARRMVTPPHRAADQAQYMTSPFRENAPSPLFAATSWALEHLDQPLHIRELASRVHLSPRQLSRKFLDVFGCTPGAWLVRERIRRAQELLETSDLTIDTIALRCGFTTTAGLRTAFHRHVHTSPSAYRTTWAN